MKPVQTGDVLHCEGCGVEVTVTKSCGCQDCAILCCGKPMKPKETGRNRSCCCG